MGFPVEHTNLVALIFGAIERHPQHVAQRYWNGQTWQDRTFRELGDVIRQTAEGLKSLGVSPGERVAIMAKTRPEWIIADLAIQSLGAVTVPIYPSTPQEQVTYVVEDADIHRAIVESPDMADKWPPSVTIRWMTGDPVQRMDQWWGDRVPSLTPYPSRRSDLATIVYTSGTTGLPKGVMLTHGNLLANIEAILALRATSPAFTVTREDVALSFLPLSHILERMVHLLFLSQGVTIAYAESPERIPANLREIRPTVMVAVPRIFEKLYAAILDQMTRAGGVKRRLFDWAIRQGIRRYERFWQWGGSRPVWGWADRWADRLVYRRIRQAVGGRLRFVISGGAALNPVIGQFFYAVGIPVIEGYGLTETAPVLAVNWPDRPRYGTVGRPLPEVTLQLAPDGEILARGPNITPGYWNRPEETQEAFQDGWFHTGDLGEWTPDGFLRVTDRKKYIIVLSTGKNVAPQAVEQKLLLSPWIEQAVVLGNRQKYVAALLYLNPEKVQEWARLHHRDAPSYPELLQDAELSAFMMQEVERVTADLAPFERPKKVAFLPHELTEAAGELTPSLKVKMNVVEERYRSLIDTLFESVPVVGGRKG
ncbi:AMP-dependent synthetase and ligase [Sulfobacillus acidophilus TPY]|nr:AMP-dependent synthetase and ligase [Sulfobacillus acidophilus TPY]